MDKLAINCKISSKFDFSSKSLLKKFDRAVNYFHKVQIWSSDNLKGKITAIMLAIKKGLMFK